MSLVLSAPLSEVRHSAHSGCSAIDLVLNRRTLKAVRTLVVWFLVLCLQCDPLSHTSLDLSPSVFVVCENPFLFSVTRWRISNVESLLTCVLGTILATEVRQKQHSDLSRHSLKSIVRY